jgi:hypothetical protein
MNIQEVSDILGVCRFLRAPKHVFITDESVYEERDGRTFFRGLQPEKRRDIIFLSAQADGTTVPHEGWHAMTGLGEITAYPVGRLVSIKYGLLSNFPNLKQMLSRQIEYRRVYNSREFPEAEKYGNRIEHYELVG